MTFSIETDQHQHHHRQSHHEHYYGNDHLLLTINYIIWFL